MLYLHHHAASRSNKRAEVEPAGSSWQSVFIV